jgi:two-component system response regulator GlrR
LNAGVARRESALGGRDLVNRTDDDLGGGRVLVVEDDRDARTALVLLLEDWGFEVTAAASGEAALALPEVEGFRIAFLDVDLPGCSGFAVRDGLRARSPALPVIFLSGSGGRASGDGPLERRLLKPVDLETIEEALRSLLAIHTSPAA